MILSHISWSHTNTPELSKWTCLEPHLGQLGALGNINGNFYYNYWDNGSYYNLFGVPSGAPFIGSFKIDNDNGVIILNVNYY